MQTWDVLLLLLFPLLLLEFWALTHWGFFRFGIPVWQERWDAFPSGTPGTPVTHGDDTYWMASEDVWLFQRKSLSLGLLQYKGAIRRTEQGASVSVVAPFSSVALVTAAGILFVARGDGAAGLLLLVAVGLVLFAWVRGRAAASRLKPSGTCLTSASS